MHKLIDKIIREFPVYYAGFFLITAMVIGGGTIKGNYLDTVMQVLALPYIFQLFLHFSPRKSGVVIFSIGLGIFLLFLFQITPVLFWREHAILSVHLGRTLDSFIFFIAVFAFFHRVLMYPDITIPRLLPFLLLGVFLNIVVFLLQLVARDTSVEFAFFPFVLRGGFFANTNHTSALLYTAVPFIIYAFRGSRWWIMSIPILGLLIAIQMLVGSQAGAANIILVTLVTYFILINKPIVRWAIIGSGLLFGLLLFFFIPEFDTGFGDARDLNRWVFFQNTTRAAIDHLPFGTGFGTFLDIYPQYGVKTGVFNEFVNHAHNDFLELFLEGGILFVLLLLSYFAALFHAGTVRDFSDLRKISLCAICFLLLHNIIDYPLRTGALAMVFAYLNAVYFAPLRPDPATWQKRDV